MIKHQPVRSDVSYGVYDQGSFTPTPKLNGIVGSFFSSLYQNKSCLMLVNQKKMLLQQVYKNLYTTVSKNVKTSMAYVDELIAGAFTNYMAPGFIEPDVVLMVLTKRYNQKQMRIIKELSQAKIKVYLITLNTTIYCKDSQLLPVEGVKGLYWMMYSFLSMNKNLSYEQFITRFKLKKEKLDFKSLI